MGLPARQRRALAHIDRALRGSDPRLVALYAIFGRLAQADPIPRFEQLRSGLLTRLALVGAVFAAIGYRLHIRFRFRLPFRLRLRPRQRAILLYPLAIALAVGSIVLAARSGPDRGCLPVRAVAAAKNVAKSSLCQPQGSLSPVMFGH